MVTFLQTLAAVGPFLLVVAAVGGWLFLDATAHGARSPALWTVCAVVVPPAFLFYVAVYRRHTDRERPPTPAERSARPLAAAGVCSLVLTAFLAPPDPFSQGPPLLAAFVATSLAFLLGRRFYENWVTASRA